MMVCVKASTFGILRMEGTGDEEKPTAFLITAAQRSTLLAETQELGRKKGNEQTYVDFCVDILLSTMNSKLPTA
jgi:hypothetical protein